MVTDIEPPSGSGQRSAEGGGALMPGRGRAAVEILLIFLVLLLHAGLLRPEVNEPYYLAKAKHFWNPRWCSGDFFLQTADSHAVFYWVCGWWTLWLSLPATALVGRLVTYALLAFAWRRLCAAVVPGGWWSVLSAALLVTFGSRVDMAGEWVVGGFEAKGLAYAAVLLALEALARNRWSRAWITLGIATSLHVLVGGWSLIAAWIVWLGSAQDPDRPRLRAMLGGLVAGAALALPGVVPVLLLDRGADAATITRSAAIQVFQRLGHHLDPGHFLFSGGLLTAFGWRFAALTLLWATLCRLTPPDAQRRRFERFVLSTLLIGGVGLLIYDVTFGLMENTLLAAAMLRFYWFRLGDAMLPAGAAIAVTAYLAADLKRRPKAATAWLGVTLAVAIIHLGCQTYDHWGHRVPIPDQRIAPTPARFADWLAVCHAVNDMTPPSAVFLVPPGTQTFKWYANRAEVVDWKEVPQDSKAVLRWRDRLMAIRGWPGNSSPLNWQGRGQLLAWGRTFGAQFLVVPAEPRIDLHCLYRNNSFALYALKPPR